MDVKDKVIWDLRAQADIPQVMYRYCRAVDRLDETLLRQVFHPDARIELGGIYAGDVEGFIPVAMGFMGSMIATRHDITNVLIEVSGETAGVESYVQTWHLLDTPEGRHELLVVARYIDQFAWRHGRWAIQKHSEVMDWGDMKPALDAWFQANAELPKGRRDQQDLSYEILPHP